MLLSIYSVERFYVTHTTRPFSANLCYKNDIALFAYSHFLRMKNLTGRVNFHRFLRLAAEVILKIECAGAGVKIGGSVTGLVGTGMVIAGNTLSLLYYHV